MRRPNYYFNLQMGGFRMRVRRSVKAGSAAGGAVAPAPAPVVAAAPVAPAPAPVAAPAMASVDDDDSTAADESLTGVTSTKVCV
jgi:hypothetical protein